MVREKLLEKFFVRQHFSPQYYAGISSWLSALPQTQTEITEMEEMCPFALTN